MRHMVWWWLLLLLLHTYNTYIKRNLRFEILSHRHDSMNFPPTCTLRCLLPPPNLLCIIWFSYIEMHFYLLFIIAVTLWQDHVFCLWPYIDDYRNGAIYNFLTLCCASNIQYMQLSAAPAPSSPLCFMHLLQRCDALINPVVLKLRG